jgi:hypothetical protein
MRAPSHCRHLGAFLDGGWRSPSAMKTGAWQQLAALYHVGWTQPRAVVRELSQARAMPLATRGTTQRRPVDDSRARGAATPTVPLPLHAQARAVRAVPQHWLHLNKCASAVQARGRADSADEVNYLLLRRGLWQLKARRSQREAPRSWRVTHLTSRSSMHTRAPAQSDASARRQGADS